MSAAIIASLVATAVAHGAGEMDMDMDMGSSSNSSSEASSMMAMTFFTDFDTPLWSDAWTPKSMGQYAGTCIFLIFLALLLRAILALKGILETHVWQSAMPYGHMHGHAHHGAHRISESSDEAKAGMADASLVKSVRAQTRPWRLSVDGTRAVLDLIMVGIGYLLMLAVMTYNIGYFLSVLAGSFLGSLLLGRFAIMGGGVC